MQYRIRLRTFWNNLHLYFYPGVGPSSERSFYPSEHFVKYDKYRSFDSSVLVPKLVEEANR
jgi:hypothetical protein